MKLDGSKSFDEGFSSSSNSGGIGILGLGAAAVLSSSGSGSLLGPSGAIGTTAGGMGAYYSVAPVSGSSSNSSNGSNNSSTLFAVGLDAVSAAIDSSDLTISAGSGESVGAYGAEGDSTEGMLV
jgi:hypothetical protein